ncbi:MAG: 1-phosphofructokinase family hexose kinase [Anaerolineae bacterium]|nr:1-phosphofructokinase family hexose kinase [Anaerolineae bacterium]
MSAGETRTCLLLTHATGEATVINEPGPVLSRQDWQRCLVHIQGLAQQARAVAIAGSLPLGVAPETLGVLARSLVSPERAVYVDTSGEALRLALELPDGLGIKVNRAELAAGLRLPLDTLGQMVQAGQTLLTRGAVLVVVTQGRAGAVAISPEGCWQATAPPVETVSTVGSGDSMLAGLAVARLKGESIDAALALGVACGAANALNNRPGYLEWHVTEKLLAQVRIKKI